MSRIEKMMPKYVLSNYSVGRKNEFRGSRTNSASVMVKKFGACFDKFFTTKYHSYRLIKKCYEDFKVTHSYKCNNDERT